MTLTTAAYACVKTKHSFNDPHICYLFALMNT